MEKNFKENIDYFRNKNKLELNFISNNDYDISEYIIEFNSKTGKQLEKIENLTDMKKNKNLIVDHNENKIIKFKKRKFFKKKYFKKSVK